MSSTSVSGLSEARREHARDVINRGVVLLMKEPAGVHYTQGASRWEGIDKNLQVVKGQYPHYGDCSSTATWLLWNGLYVPYGVHDIVNGENWRAGFTGTMLHHGKPVQHRSNIRVGDLVIYGSGGSGEHVALCIGGGKVFSHGSEAGPFILDIDYRRDIMSIRRYI
jgi:hypothetical protein